MRFEAINVEDIPHKVNSYKATKLLQFFEDIDRSGCAAVEVMWRGDYVSPNVCVSTLMDSAKRFGKTHFRLIRREDRVFILNTLKTGSAKVK